MNSKVYFSKISDYSDTKKINKESLNLLKIIKKENKIKFKEKLPIKVHFGEKGNNTFIEAKN